jgi:hypothetical protein
MNWACSTNVGEEKYISDIAGKRKRPLGRRRRRWVESIKWIIEI